MDFDLQKIIQYIGFFILKLGPLFISFFFIFDSIFQNNLKGIIYIVGLIIAMVFTILVGNTVSFLNKNEPDIDMCFPVKIDNFVNISNLPLSQSVYGFTFLYLLIPMIKYNFIGYNSILLILFSCLIFTDMYLLSFYNCFSLKQIIFSLIVGSAFGIMYMSVLLSSNKKNIIYMPGIPQTNTCDLPKRKAYRCRVKQV